MSKTLVTMYDGEHWQFEPLTLPPIRRYAQRHGYDVQVIVGMPYAVDRGQHSCWSKLPAIAQALGRSEIVMWVDGDVFIVDHTADPADLLEPGKFIAILQDARYGICGALFAVRNCPAAMRFLFEAWEMRGADFPDWDQGAMKRLLDRDEYQAGTVLLGHDWFGPEGSGPDARIIHGCRQTAQTVPDRVRSLQHRVNDRLLVTGGTHVR